MISEILKDMFNICCCCFRDKETITTAHVIDHLDELADYEMKWIMNKFDKNKNKLYLCR